MIKLIVKNSKTIIICDEKLMDKISDLLSFEIEGASFAIANNPFWDGRTRLLKRKRDGSATFPTGLLRRVFKYCKLNNIQIEAASDRIVPQAITGLKMRELFDPRDYQLKCRELSKDLARGVFVIGTGGGKTYIACHLIEEKSVPTLFITPDTDLREQTYNTFKKHFVGDVVGKDISDEKPIIVANIQSLTRKDKKFFQRFGMIIIDEFHHCLAACHKIETMTRGRKLLISDIYERVMRGRSVTVKSWNGDSWEPKKVTKAFRYKTKEMLRVKVQDEDGKIRELLVTRKHKFLTDRGKIEIGSMNVGDELTLGYKTHKEAMRTRGQNEEYKKYLSERATINNSKRSPKARASQSKKIKKLIKDGKYNPYGRGRLGNGGELSNTQQRVLDLMGGVAEYSVTIGDGERPYHYKIDIAFVDSKIAIEVDGSSHRGRASQDKRKNERLWSLGWKVVRIPENCSKEGLLVLKKSIAKTNTSMT